MHPSRAHGLRSGRQPRAAQHGGHWPACARPHWRSTCTGSRHRRCPVARSSGGDDGGSSSSGRGGPAGVPGQQQHQGEQQKHQQLGQHGEQQQRGEQRDEAASLGSLQSELQLLQTWWPEAARTFPKVPWGPNDLLKVMCASLAAAALFGAASTLLLRAPPGELPAAGAPAAALRHLAREGLLASLLPAAVLAALAPARPRERGLLQARWEPGWAARTVLICAVLFPLVDPLLYRAWEPAMEALFGPPAASPLVGEVQAAVAAADWGAVGAHLAASGLVGPIWEEVFWRGFFLASLAKVLPPRACVAASSLPFAALHLSPYNFAPLLALSATADALYLRTHNLLPPLLLHCAWNSGQLLAVAFLGKQEFV